MSSSRKPQAGEPVALSANALADAYRAADIVLGKDGGFIAGEQKNLQNNYITISYRSRIGETFNVGEAISFEHLTFSGQASAENEDDLIRYSSKVNQKNHSHNVASLDSGLSNKHFGIIKAAEETSSRQWNFKLQIKGLVYVRCLMFANAWAVGPPVATYDPTYGRKYPCGNWYGSVPVISKGRFVVIDDPSVSQTYPRIQECLIDLG
jgi:hypothetical protein